MSLTRKEEETRIVVLSVERGSIEVMSPCSCSCGSHLPLWEMAKFIDLMSFQRPFLLILPNTFLVFCKVQVHMSSTHIHSKLKLV